MISVTTDPISVADEFRNLKLGDARLNARAVRIAEAVSVRPAESFPFLMADNSELESLYRFFRNPRVGERQLVAPHIDRSLDRTQREDRVLVVHDSSVFSYSGERKQMGVTYKKTKGFMGHDALLVSADGNRLPFGLGAVNFFDRGVDQGKGKSRKRKDAELKMKPRAEKLSSRWENQAFEVEKRMTEATTRWAYPHPPDLIHIMDAEADDFIILELMVSNGHSAIIRGSGDRKVISRELVSTVISRAPVLLTRDILVSQRGKSLDPKNRSHPERSERLAHLEIRGSAVELKRANHAQTKTASININVVEVREPNPPVGEEPISWTLYTTLPIGTPEELADVVEFYRARWMIEEYFKVLKTCCAVEQRQLETAKALQRSIAIFSVIAWQILLMRALSRQPEPPPASLMFTEEELDVVNAIVPPRSRLGPNPTVKDVLYAIAARGGHLTRNGPPGNLVLARGMRDFFLALGVWRRAHRAWQARGERCDQ